MADLESLVQERVAKARAELESRLRAQIEQEMMRDVEQSKKREVHDYRTLIRVILIVVVTRCYTCGPTLVIY